MVLKRRRIKGLGFEVSLGWCYRGLLTSIDGTAVSRSLVAQKQVQWHLAHLIPVLFVAVKDVV